VWHLFVVSCDDRGYLTPALDSAGIGWGIHYPCPPHLQQAYACMGLGPGSFPAAERISASVLSLPMDPFLPEADARLVCAAL